MASPGLGARLAKGGPEGDPEGSLEGDAYGPSQGGGDVSVEFIMTNVVWLYLCRRRYDKSCQMCAR